MTWQRFQVRRAANATRRRSMTASSAVAASSIVGVVLLFTSASATVAARHGEPPPMAAFSRLTGIPSHNGTYRASLVRTLDPASRSGEPVWNVEVASADGVPVEGAILALESWMPDHDRPIRPQPRVSGDLGVGRYRVAGLRFERRGWWNVRLRIDGRAGTDSLAFNLVR
jgi:YtkA-like protein